MIYAEVDDQGRILYDDIEKLLQENHVDYVTVTAASNVTGYVTDVHRVAALAHKYGAKIIVDGAQIVAHRQFSMLGESEDENIDFFVFSAHKMYSPYGGVATRRGAFCAHPYVWRLVGVDPDSALDAFGSCEDIHTPGMIRVSFGIYNTEEEVDAFLKILPDAIAAAQAETERLNNQEMVVRYVEPSY